MTNLLGVAITWLGHAAVHVETAKGTSILIDPFLEHNPAYPKTYVFPNKIDLVLATHGHCDHIVDAAPIATKYDSTVIAVFELAAWLASKGVKKTVGINIGGSFRFEDLVITMVEAKHSSDIQDGDRFLTGGVAAGFILTIDDCPVLYHSGDTTVFTDMKLIGELYSPQLGMLPIGGHYTMGPREAAVAAKYLGIKTVLPIHFGTFPPLKGTPTELEIFLQGSGIEVVKIEPGTVLR